jgi:hypothetical protein
MRIAAPGRRFVSWRAQLCHGAGSVAVTPGVARRRGGAARGAPRAEARCGSRSARESRRVLVPSPRAAVVAGTAMALAGVSHGHADTAVRCTGVRARCAVGSRQAVAVAALRSATEPSARSGCPRERTRLGGSATRATVGAGRASPSAVAVWRSDTATLHHRRRASWKHNDNYRHWRSRRRQFDTLYRRRTTATLRQCAASSFVTTDEQHRHTAWS